MSHKFMGERTLMRIFIGGSDRCLKGEHKGRGITGFGASAKVHTDSVW